MTSWKSACFRSGVMLQPLSVRLPSGLRFFQPPLPATSTAYLAVMPAGIRQDDGLTLFRLHDTNELAPAFYTGSRNVRVLQVFDGATGCMPFG